jgi:DNA polymerase III psi subunit
VVILDHTWDEYSDGDKILLQKILSSVKLNLPMVNIITKKQFALADLAALNPERVVSFGATSGQVPGLYECLKSEGVQMICADSLQKMDDSRKKSLWAALRQMFNI